MVWAFSPSFQKSGREVAWFSSSIRFCLASRSKTPPQKLQALFQLGQLLSGFFEHVCLFIVIVIVVVYLPL
jgi:hypothetical protein